MEFSIMQPPLSSVYCCLVFGFSSECSAFEALLRLTSKYKINPAEPGLGVLIKLHHNSDIITEERVCTVNCNLLSTSSFY
jgi:hypothetical protein